MPRETSPRKGNIALVIVLVVAAVAIAAVAWYASSKNSENTNILANANGNSANTSVNGEGNTNTNRATSGTNQNTNTTSSFDYENATYGYGVMVPEGHYADVDSQELVFIRASSSSSRPLPTIEVVHQSSDEYVTSLVEADQYNEKRSDEMVVLNTRTFRRVVIATAAGVDIEHNLIEREGFVIDVLGMQGDAVFNELRDSFQLL